MITGAIIGTLLFLIVVLIELMFGNRHGVWQFRVMTIMGLALIIGGGLIGKVCELIITYQ